MATTPRTGDPEASKKAPAVPKKAPAKAKTRVVNDATRTAVDTYGANIGTYQDYANYPGLLKGESKGLYNSWLAGLASKSPEQWQLIQLSGPKMQTLLWRAYRDNADPNTILNLIASEFGPDVFAPGPGGGGSRGGGGGGGGGGAPTPEQIAAAKAEIINRTASLGHTPLTEDVLTFVATTLVRDNWTSAQLDDWLLAKPEDITAPGLVQVSIDEIRKMASNQLLTVSDETARDWAMRINSGEMDPNAVASIFQEQATREFAWAANGIAQGLTVRDMLAPQRDIIAKELDLGADQVDLMDPKWRNMVTVTDPASNAPRAATLTEAVRNARKDSRYADTSGAGTNTAGIFMMLRQNFEGT